MVELNFKKCPLFLFFNKDAVMFRCGICSIFFARKPALTSHFEDLHLVILSDKKAKVVPNKREYLRQPNYGMDRLSNEVLPQISGPRAQSAANQSLSVGDTFSVRNDILGIKSTQSAIQNEPDQSKKDFQDSVAKAREQSKLANDLMNLLMVECSKCSKMLNDEEDLAEHMDRFHLNADPDEKPFMCGYCDLCFNQVF